MSEPASHLLVPIKVEALVIDDNPDRSIHAAVDRKWSPNGSSLTDTVDSFAPTGPPLFLGVEPGGAAPSWEPDDYGVYVHWVLPPGLRHAHGFPQQALALPPLPDQWLVVRFLRPASTAEQPAAEAETKAWFVDGGLLDAHDHPRPAEVLWPDPDDSYLTARPIGHSVAFPDDYGGGYADAERVTVTALGSAHTGSPTFSAFVADNRNVLSFHDTLADVRRDGVVPDGTTFSYLVLGWYRTEASADEPLAYVRSRLAPAPPLAGAEKSAILKALGWQVDAVVLPVIEGPDRLTAEEEQAAFQKAEAALPPDLLAHRCLFHGMVAHVNYFAAAYYQGPLLGYPGAPPAHGGEYETGPTVEVGIGHNAADALIALVADAAGGASAESEQDAAALWKALEAVVYRRTGSLLGGWHESPREHAVHQAWFSPQDGGLQWNITAQERAAGTDEAPATEQLEHFYDRLAQLNSDQTAANNAAHDLAVTQQELFARWWLLLRRTVTGEEVGPDKKQLHSALDQFAQESATLRETLATRTATVEQDADALRAQLNAAGLELRQEAAPRFWQPTDPVIVIHNAGTLEKHAFPTPLRCRTAVQTYGVVAALGGEQHDFRPPQRSDVADIDAALHVFPATDALKALFEEALLVEQAADFLAVRSAAVHQLDDERTWRMWTEFLQRTLTGWDDTLEQKRLQVAFPPAHLAAEAAGDNPDLLPRLMQFWRRQPWSPLFLDWRVTWFPDAQLGSDFSGGWRLAADANDYRPAAGYQIREGISLSGRSLMAPQMGGVFTDPIDALRALLSGERQADHGMDAQVAAVLAHYLEAWQGPLQELAQGGLLGQALSGFHQVLLGRDSRAARITPHPTYPWMLPPDGPWTPDAARPWLPNPADPQLAGSDERDYSDGVLLDCGLLTPPHLFTVDQRGEQQRPGKAVALPSLAPAGTAPAVPFGLLKGGVLRIDALSIIDDFGQWFDVLGGSADQLKCRTAVSPHCRFPDHNNHPQIVQPPRVLQPARLYFRFVDSDFAHDSGDHPQRSPVCGWVFHNYLDHALTLCDAEGHLLGELALVETPDGMAVRWDCLQVGRPADTPLADIVREGTLRAFAQPLLDGAVRPMQKLQALLALIDDALATMRPATAEHRLRIAGRPLALVNARIGLELFGRTWRDPLATSATGSGDDALTRLRLPVQLGQADVIADGLVGYFKRSGPRASMQKIVAVRQPAAFADATGYLGSANPNADAVQVGFGRPDAAPDGGGWQTLTLLIDPFGAVHAGAGLLPAESIQLPKVYLDHARENMELSFRVAPLLVRPVAAAESDRENGPSLKLPVALPADRRGRWRFMAPPDGGEQFDIVPPTDKPDYGGAPLTINEGRLALGKEDDP